MKQMDGEMKQNVLGRCPEGKVNTTHCTTPCNTMQYHAIPLNTNEYYWVVFTLPFGHLPNTFCFISPSICFISPTNLLHFPNKLLRFPNKMLHFPNKLLHFPNHFLISPTQFCVTLPKNKIIKIQTSAYQNPDS